MALPINIFCCYAHKDQHFLLELKNHLSPLERQGLIKIISDVDISPGSNWESEINKHLNLCKIILLLVSPDFIASPYCYTKEMEQALKRHKQGNVFVIPIIVRSVYWKTTPLGELQALPKDARPIKDWSNKDKAYVSVVEVIYSIIGKIQNTPVLPAYIPPQPQSAPQNNIMSKPTQPTYIPPRPQPQTVPQNNIVSTPVLPTYTSPQPQSASQNNIVSTPVLPAYTPPQPQSISQNNISSTPQPTYIPPQPQPTPQNNGTSTPVQPTYIPLRPQPQPTPQNNAVQPAYILLLKITLFRIFKITLYFVGMTIAEFGFLGGSIEIGVPSSNLSNVLGGISFSIGLITLVISIYIFFKKQYFLRKIPKKQYVCLIGGATLVLIIGFILALSILPGASTDPSKSAEIAYLIACYGIVLVIITHLKST